MPIRACVPLTWGVGMLELEGLCGGYGLARVLDGVSLRVAPGQIVALLGRNGAGRSTTARAIMGLLPTQGVRRWCGRSLQGLRPFELARMGLAYVPESRDVFPHLSVAQNLRLGQPGAWRRGAPRWTPEDAYTLFPSLRVRHDTPAGVLSGGEQQMLSLARALMGDPGLLIVDEPTEGLAPMLVAQVADFLQGLRAQGVGVLLIEQKLNMALDIADRVLVMGHGRIVFEGEPQTLRARQDVRREWLEV